MKPYEIKFKRDTAFRKQFFVPDSFAHPAKMDAQLLIWIVERYTESGETILDPMAGSGTTMLACGLGRNVVLVELEEKFCKMMRNNWEIVKMHPQLGYSMGDCQIIQGDARQLEGLLVDKCIFSPPYAEATHYTDDPNDLIDFTPGRTGRVSGTAGKSDGNIGQFPYGSIDKIVTSPPYEETLTGGGQKHKEGFTQGQTQGKDAFKGGYTGIDAVVTSPPYEEAMGEKHHSPRADKLAKEKRNPTTYTGIDAVVTSPPYEDSLHRWEGISEKEVAKRLPQPYTDAKEDNIGNLKSDSYLEAMLQVYAQCWGILKDGGLMILVTKNFIRNKQVVRLDKDTIKLCEQAGFTYLERHYRKLPSQSFWRVIYHQKHPEVEQINHEDILVFQKQMGELKV